MAKVRRLYTLGEAAATLGVQEKEVKAVLNQCAPDFSARTSKKLNQDEVNCVDRVLQQRKDNVQKP